MKLLVASLWTVSLLSLTQHNRGCPLRPLQPPECTSIAASDATTGKAPLYGSRLDGKTYIVVCMIRGMDGVKYVDKSTIFKPSAITRVWGLDRIDQRNLPLDGVYFPSGNGDGVTVYVVDSGVNTKHVEFGGRAENWHEVVTGTGEDCFGHGTHVAGTVAAATHGVASGVNIRSVRIFGCAESSPFEVIAEGLNHILAHGDSGSIVTMSLGGPQSHVADEAVKSLIRAGFVVVVSAGNENEDACGRSPARVTEAITVGATNQSDQRATFSNFGTGVDIFAPGVRVESLDYRTNNGTLIFSGTPMSAPHVSGVAAILRSRGIPAGEVRQRIIDLSSKDIVQNPNGSNNRLLFIE
ncbi:aqualysin-1-like isoform X2 [Anneissia japonica]|uniref:aqualysin-1-like isoform X2 n=1 Tax=Anneissia japonica TaxID=1529436 RepID=UPI0014259EE2|nr:aqualysin-1-like isoform X2 [Anneissia japonica]